MTDNISDGVYILTWQDLNARETRAFNKGVERGRLDERIKIGKEPVALNCANWKDGRCETCGAQHQGMEVGGDFKCPNFVRRSR